MAASNKSTARGASARASNMPLRIWAMHATCNSSSALNTGTYELPPSVCKKPALGIEFREGGQREIHGQGRVGSSLEYASTNMGHACHMQQLQRLKHRHIRTAPIGL